VLQVAALTWNGNSKLRALFALLGHLPPVDAALTGKRNVRQTDRQTDRQKETADK
jgi:hypothetical protein